MDNRTLCQLASALLGKSATEVDTILRQKHLHSMERMSVKIQIDAMATHGRSMHATGHQKGERRPRSMMDRLLDRVGVDDQRTYTDAELGTLLAQAGVDAETRIACKVEAQARGLLRDPSPVERLLQSLSIDGPVDQLALELEMDRAGYGVVAKNIVKAELQQRGWLQGGGSSMRASAAKGTRLVDGRGRSLTLRSRPA